MLQGINIHTESVTVLHFPTCVIFANKERKRDETVFLSTRSEHELMLTRNSIQRQLTFVWHNYGLSIALCLVISASPQGNNAASDERNQTFTVYIEEKEFSTLNIAHVHF